MKRDVTANQNVGEKPKHKDETAVPNKPQSKAGRRPIRSDITPETKFPISAPQLKAEPRIPASNPSSVVDKLGKKFDTMNGRNEKIIQILALLASRIIPSNDIFANGTGVGVTVGTFLLLSFVLILSCSFVEFTVHGVYQSPLEVYLPKMTGPKGCGVVEEGEGPKWCSPVKSKSVYSS